MRSVLDEQVAPIAWTSAIEAIYACVLDPNQRDNMINEVVHFCGAAGAAIIPISLTDSHWRIGSNPDPQPNRVYYEHWQHFCPIRTLLTPDPDGVLRYLDDSFLSDREIGRHSFYQDFLRVYGVGRRSVALLTPTLGRPVLFSVQGDAAYTIRPDMLRRQQQLLTPHIHSALAAAFSLETARIQLQAALDVLHRQCQPLAVIGRDSRPIMMNPAFERVLGDGLNMLFGRLTASLLSQRSILERLIRDAGRDSSLPTLARLERPSGKQALLLRVIPLSAEHTDMIGLSDAPPVLIMLPPQDPDETTERLLGEMGLTRREAQVARLIGTAHTPAEVSESLGLQIGTVRQILKGIFPKLMVNTQSQLTKVVQAVSTVGLGV